MTKVRSPLFYVGDKYKLMPQLNKLFPKNINTFYDVFAGGGSSTLYTPAKQYELNDLDEHIISLHKYLSKELQDYSHFVDHELGLIDHYGLSHSAENVLPDNIDEIKKKYKKTYFAKANKDAYIKLRDDYNDDQSRMDLFYLLLVYGFNHMTRFNGSGNFNLPVGNVDWNKNVEDALNNYSFFVKTSKFKFSSMDFEKFVESQDFQTDDFVYFDPPYLISLSEYNKMWNEDTDLRLFNLLDELNKRHVKWGMSNVISHKGNVNTPLMEWGKSYNVYPIKSNYISKFDNTIKKDTKEIYVTNV
ncbi:DNA adenine methylase [Lactobacillus sp. Sy-1]|uniref:DNA adenine methylase n=1 Tax=Lactobacillus sp. Sy-1 TaxID=2109645 RepID=UPI001C5B82B6|nr:DNA adenine methylase [Lactobacillus sp. Sy-1]MBW1606460.1 DNA adenine methylase [Lactobacillus sp. Sy-1]